MMAIWAELIVEVDDPGLTRSLHFPMVLVAGLVLRHLLWREGSVRSAARPGSIALLGASGPGRSSLAHGLSTTA